MQPNVSPRDYDPSVGMPWARPPGRRAPPQRPSSSDTLESSLPPVNLQILPLCTREHTKFYLHESGLPAHLTQQLESKLLEVGPVCDSRSHPPCYLAQDIRCGERMRERMTNQSQRCRRTNGT